MLLAPQPNPRRTRSDRGGLLAVWLGIAGAGALACSPAPPPSPDEAFNRFAGVYLEDVLRLWPTQATHLGNHQHDGALEDYSEEGIHGAVAAYEKHLEALRQISRDPLSLPARLDYDLISNDIESSLFALTRLRQHTWDPNLYNETLGFSALLLTLQDEKSEVWPARLSALLSRLRQVPRFIASAKANLANSSPTLIHYTLEQVAGNMDFFRQALPPLFDKAPAIKAELERENAAAIAAMEEYARWLKEELLPRATGDWRLGKEMWVEKLRYALHSPLTPDEIIRRAEEMLTRTRQEMLEIAEPMHARMFPGHRHRQQGDERIHIVVSEVIGKISENHSTPEGLVRDVQGFVEKIKTFIRERKIITLPPDTDNLAIEPTPGFLNGLAVAFFHPAPALEPELKKSYWISSVPSTGDPAQDRKRQQSYLREYNHYGLQSLTIHEAFPGHYVQSYLTQHSPIVTVYRRVFESGTFIEVWAVLMEKILFENGYADGDPALLLIHKKISLRVPMNAILDARLHTGSMNDTEADRWALDFMTRQGFQEQTEATGKLRRAKVSSGQLSTYFVGYTELNDLYTEVKQKMGLRFALQEFCDRLASYGALPPDMLREQMLADLKL